MELHLSPEHEFLPSTLEHRPLHHQEKVALKAYFKVSGENEYEAFQPTKYATSKALADLEAWGWGFRMWGRECHVRATAAAVGFLGDLWDNALGAAADDPVPLAAAHSVIMSPAEAVSSAFYWANIPGELKASRIMERIKPLPAAWLEEPMHSELRQKVFIYGAMAGKVLLDAILEKRDIAAQGASIAYSGAAIAKMLMGSTEEEAIQALRFRIIEDLRAWMGYKW